MMKVCPECGGKIPETESECPICGSIQDPCFDSGSAMSRDIAEEGENETRSPGKSSRSFLRFFLEPLLFLLALIVAAVIVIAADFKGARTELRRICMTDSGDGSETDSQHSRITVKHYILVFLDLFDQGGTGESVPINTDAFNHRRFPGSDAEKKELEQKKRDPQPLMLPPTPPDVKPLDLPQENKPEDGKVFPETVNRGTEKALPSQKEETPAL